MNENKKQNLGTSGVRNRIVIIVGLLLMLLVGTGFFGIFETHTLIQANADSTKQGHEVAEARKLTARTAMSFKDQIHEWKNVLLRGQNQEDFDKYVAAFNEQNNVVIATANRAKKAYLAAGQDAAPIDEFLSKLDLYTEKCHTSATAANIKEVNWAIKTDSLVRGLDRPAAAILDAAVDKLGKAYDQIVEENAEKSLAISNQAKLVSYILLGLGLVVGIASFPILLKNINTIIGGIRVALSEAENQQREAESQRLEAETQRAESENQRALADKQRGLTEAMRKKIEEEYRALENNIHDLLKAVSDASDGNMGSRAKVTEGALGSVADAFNQMMEAFCELVTDIQKLANNTQSMADEIGTSSEQLAAGATSQAAELVTANQSVTSMGQSLQKVSENAETAALAARRTQVSALQGSNSAQNVVKGMETLRQNVQAGAKKIKNLGDRSMEITGIVGAIAKISDQTNMLALNAAIEAARAGEHGRGFSVVADEVRKLAERTAAATQEIERLVRDIQTETNESVAAIEQQTQVVEEQAGVVTHAGESLMKIQQAGTESAELIGDISHSSIKQAQGASALVLTMQRVSGIAQATKERVEKTVKSARELGSLATNLTRSVAKFRMN